MWYFVEKNGLCISKHKVLISAKLKRYEEIKKGTDPAILKVTDAKGKRY